MKHWCQRSDSNKSFASSLISNLVSDQKSKLVHRTTGSGQFKDFLKELSAKHGAMMLLVQLTNPSQVLVLPVWTGCSCLLLLRIQSNINVAKTQTIFYLYTGYIQSDNKMWQRYYLCLVKINAVILCRGFQLSKTRANKNPTLTLCGVLLCAWKWTISHC